MGGGSRGRESRVNPDLDPDTVGNNVDSNSPSGPRTPEDLLPLDFSGVDPSVRREWTH